MSYFAYNLKSEYNEIYYCSPDKKSKGCAVIVNKIEIFEEFGKGVDCKD